MQPLNIEKERAKLSKMIQEYASEPPTVQEKRFITNEEAKEIRLLFLAGWSISNIARAYEVTPAAIHYRVNQIPTSDKWDKDIILAIINVASSEAEAETTGASTI